MKSPSLYVYLSSYPTVSRLVFCLYTIIIAIFVPILCFTITGKAIVRVLNLNIDAICVTHHQILVYDAIASLVLPALANQLLAMKDVVFRELSEHTKAMSLTYLVMFYNGSSYVSAVNLLEL